MKTSNKLLIAASLVLLSYLVIFDFQLKAEFLKGDFRGRFFDMQNTPLTNFTAVKNRAGNIIGINIEKGPKFGVWISKYIKDNVVITQHNDTLYIDNKDKIRFYNFEKGIIITCPAVSSITAVPFKIPENQYNDGSAKTSVSGFNQDMMTVLAYKSTEIELSKNSLGKLNAATGASKATLTIHGDNQINNASFNIIGKSDLKLFNVIANSSYTYTDSATVTLNGKTLRRLQQH
jgi:hypothetical protein